LKEEITDILYEYLLALLRETRAELPKYGSEKLKMFQAEL